MIVSFLKWSKSHVSAAIAFGSLSQTQSPLCSSKAVPPNGDDTGEVEPVRLHDHAACAEPLDLVQQVVQRGLVPGAASNSWAGLVLTPAAVSMSWLNQKILGLQSTGTPNKPSPLTGLHHLMSPG